MKVKLFKVIIFEERSRIFSIMLLYRKREGASLKQLNSDLGHTLYSKRCDKVPSIHLALAVAIAFHKTVLFTKFCLDFTMMFLWTNTS